jgi:V/A-type H+-transporting ATPase subunit B
MHKVYEIEQIAGNVIVVKAEGVATASWPRSRRRRARRWPRSSGSRAARVPAGVRGQPRHRHRRPGALPRAPMQVPFSERCWGASSPAAASRAIAARVLTENLTEIGGPSVNPAKRIIPRRTWCAPASR